MLSAMTSDEKRGRGRPPKPGERKETLQGYFERHESAIVRAQAKREGMPIAKLVHDLVMEGLKGRSRASKKEGR